MIRIHEKIKALRDFENNLGNAIQNLIINNEFGIVEMNVKNQLYEQGINSEGVSIFSYMPYTSLTIKLKNKKGQPVDRVTLRDTGAFHASFLVIADNTQFVISATDWKVDNLIDKYGRKILGLTDINLSTLVWSKIYPELLNELKSNI